MSESYRQTRNYENLNRCIYPGVGEFGIPELEPVHCDAETWIGFNYAKGCDVEDRPAHRVRSPLLLHRPRLSRQRVAVLAWAMDSSSRIRFPMRTTPRLFLMSLALWQI